MNEDFAFLLVFFAVSATVNVGLAIAWYRTNKRLRQLENRPAALAQIEEIPSRVDAALDAMAARLEEVAGAQDFMNRVMIERLEKGNQAP